MRTCIGNGCSTMGCSLEFQPQINPVTVKNFDLHINCTLVIRLMDRPNIIPNILTDWGTFMMLGHLEFI